MIRDSEFILTDVAVWECGDEWLWEYYVEMQSPFYAAFETGSMDFPEYDDNPIKTKKDAVKTMPADLKDFGFSDAEISYVFCNSDIPEEGN